MGISRASVSCNSCNRSCMSSPSHPAADALFDHYTTTRRGKSLSGSQSTSQAGGDRLAFEGQHAQEPLLDTAQEFAPYQALPGLLRPAEPPPCQRPSPPPPPRPQTIPPPSSTLF